MVWLILFDIWLFIFLLKFKNWFYKCSLKILKVIKTQLILSTLFFEKAVCIKLSIL